MKRFLWIITIVLIFGLLNCGGGGGSSKEAKELLTRILNLVGIPQEMVINICQDKNRDGFCAVSELQAKISIKRGDTIADIWQKIEATGSSGEYLLETFDLTLPILLELEDKQTILKYDNGKFTIPFNGLNENQESKELSILQSMIDEKHLTEQNVKAIRELDNRDAQNEFYAVLLKDFEKNINTLRDKELNATEAINKNIEEMATELLDNNIEEKLPNRINECGDDKKCIKDEINGLSEELIIDEEEATEISNSSNNNKNSGYSRDSSKKIVNDYEKNLMWQDDEAVTDIEKPWLNDANYEKCVNDKISCSDTAGDTAQNYCSSLELGGYDAWRLPTKEELESILDRDQERAPYIKKEFQNTNADYHWTASVGEEDNFAWYVNFEDASMGEGEKNHYKYIRCVRVGE